MQIASTIACDVESNPGLSQVCAIQAHVIGVGVQIQTATQHKQLSHTQQCHPSNIKQNRQKYTHITNQHHWHHPQTQRA